jgi:hypothetical protein
MSAENDCTVTHSWLLSGTCPSCAVPVLRGHALATRPASERGERRWDIGALLAALDHSDMEMRCYVLWHIR